MTDKDFRDTVKRIKIATGRWAQPCGLHMWRKIEFLYHADTAAMAAGGGVELTEEQRDVAGRAQVDWQYREARIHINVSKLQYITDDEIDYIIRHEICHVLVSEMREWSNHGSHYNAINHEERVVSDLAAILGWVRQAGVEDRVSKSKKTTKKK